ncbi:MAG: hypothetical protein GF334_01795 [Candidatus Altiarchaeales archaeon]|nr:hypothetical protein [Candidatus Altiarchaeales archaeon]
MEGETHRVLDASAVLRGGLGFEDEKYLMPSSVFREILDPLYIEKMQSLIRLNRLNVKDASKKSLTRVKEKAREVGDLVNLSDADLDVLGLALETGGVIVSDDYAIQNTAYALGVEVEHAFHEPIKQRRQYTYYCRGCGQRYMPGVTECGICGARVKRKTQKSSVERL